MEQKISSYFHKYREAPDLRHVDVLDGVRALCVGLVAWFHIWQQSWLFPKLFLAGEEISLSFLPSTGYIWVDGLLLLSGFLLYLPYAQAGDKLPRILPFYKRRLIRILPSYLLCVSFMFALALLEGKYLNLRMAGADLAAHLTFTFNLFPDTYFRTPINGALWTLAVEMQFYLLFPFLARGFRRFPVLTYCLMAGGAFAFRFFAARQADTSMYFNQLPAFLDVYANGMAAAGVFAALRKKLGAQLDGRIKLFFTVLAVLCAWLILRLIQEQALLYDSADVRQGQMDRRFLFSLALSCFMVCSCFSLAGWRFLLGNPLMRFFASVSFQFYIYHQWLAVRLRAWGFPPSAEPEPWKTADYPWKLTFSICCFLLALLLAALLTYLFEQPIARRLRKKLKAER